MSVIRKTLLAAVTAALLLGTAACSSGTPAPESTGGSEAPVAETTEIRIGFNPGPYREMFENGIQPILEEDGFTVDLRELTDGIAVNVAVAQNELDANIMQHPVYMEFVNKQEGLDNVALVQIPTPRMALFGGKKAAIGEVADGSTVTVPNSPSNLYRALLILRDAGWVEFEDVADPNTADLGIITANPHNLKITAIENAQQVPALQDVDFAVIQGNFIVAGGLDYGKALALEDQPVQFSNVVTIRSTDADTAWAKAIEAAYKSDAFIEYITSNPQYDGYNLPAWFK